MQRMAMLGCMVLFACSAGEGASGAPAAKAGVSAQVVGTSRPVTYYRDVKPIIDQKCAQCHTEGGGGHFSLQTFADVKPRVAGIKAAVADGVMPPWRASGPLDQFGSAVAPSAVHANSSAALSRRTVKIR